VIRGRDSSTIVHAEAADDDDLVVVHRPRADLLLDARPRASLENERHGLLTQGSTHDSASAT